MKSEEALTRLVTQNLELDTQIELLRHLTLDKLTPDLLSKAVLMFRDQMIEVDLPEGAIDMAGTGGDKSNTFNISTTSALVAAAAGVPIAKHGNVSISSKSGGIDLLRALNITLPETAEAAQTEFKKNQVVFLFAQVFHPIFKKFVPARRELAAEGIITIFNILGPLLNPARVSAQMIGVFKPELVELITLTLLKLGHDRALVVYGNGLDEFSLTGDNQIAELKDGGVSFYKRSPQDFGFSPCSIEQLKGGDPAENAQITLDILQGDITGPMKDIVCLNAGAAIYLAHDNLEFDEAIEKADETIQSGAAYSLLKRLAS